MFQGSWIWFMVGVVWGLSVAASSMDTKHRHCGRKPRLERRNAVKNFDYAAWSPTEACSPSPSPADIRSHDTWTSFRVDGVDGRDGFDQYCRDLGLSGPEDFAISASAWEASKACSSFDMISVGNSKLTVASDDRPELSAPRVTAAIGSEVRVKPKQKLFGATGGGIKGNRLPVLAPPPSMSLPALDWNGSTWDLVRSFAPDSLHRLVIRRTKRRLRKLMSNDPGD